MRVLGAIGGIDQAQRRIADRCAVTTYRLVVPGEHPGGSFNAEACHELHNRFGIAHQTIKLGDEACALAGACRLNNHENPATWRHDIDALVFRPDDHQGLCMVHRRAFRTLLRFSPVPMDCETFFRTHEGAFRAAASAKILRENVVRGMNFHLTSRDIVRQMKK